MQYVVYCLKIVIRHIEKRILLYPQRKASGLGLEITQVFFLDNPRRPGILMKFCDFFKRKDVTKSSY